MPYEDGQVVYEGTHTLNICVIIDDLAFGFQTKDMVKWQIETTFDYGILLQETRRYLPCLIPMHRLRPRNAFSLLLLIILLPKEY